MCVESLEKVGGGGGGDRFLLLLLLWFGYFGEYDVYIERNNYLFIIFLPNHWLCCQIFNGMKYEISLDRTFLFYGKVRGKLRYFKNKNKN